MVPEIKGTMDTIFLVIFGHILPFYPLTVLKIKILKKWKKVWRCPHFTDAIQNS